MKAEYFAVGDLAVLLRFKVDKGPDFEMTQEIVGGIVIVSGVGDQGIEV